MAIKLWIPTMASVREDVSAKTLIYCWWECQLVQLLWKIIWHQPIRLNTCIPHVPSILIPGTWLKELLHTCTHQKTKAAMFRNSKKLRNKSNVLIREQTSYDLFTQKNILSSESKEQYVTTWWLVHNNMDES